MLSEASYRSVLIGLLVAILLGSSVLVVWSMGPNQFSAFGTFPGRNGKMAFTSTRDGDAEIYVMNADGSGQTRLTTSPDADASPSWSPDGSKIAFSSQFGIYIMNSDGSSPIRLSNNPNDYDPSWSPDGTKIAFVTSKHSDGGEIYVINADGTGERNISNKPYTDIHVDWGTNVTPPPPRDTAPPVLTVQADRVVEATSEQVAQVAFTVTAQDNVDGTATLEEDGTTITQDDVGGEIAIACSPSSGSEFPLGDTLVQCSARDAAGNFNRASFTVTVNPIPPPPDTTRPVIIVPEDITEEATSTDGATVSFEVSARDDEDGSVDVSCDHNSGETFPIGETIVTCNAEDSAGNRADEKSFTITVQDTIAPTVQITKAVDKKSVEIAEGSTTKSHYIQLTFEVTDAVGIDKTECSLDGQAFTSCTSPVIYDQLKKGIHQFTVRSTDAAGNTRQDQFIWTVNPPAALAAPGRQ